MFGIYCYTPTEDYYKCTLSVIWCVFESIVYLCWCTFISDYMCFCQHCQFNCMSVFLSVQLYFCLTKEDFFFFFFLNNKPNNISSNKFILNVSYDLSWINFRLILLVCICHWYDNVYYKVKQWIFLPVKSSRHETAVGST